jgi:hypothetical protein
VLDQIKVRLLRNRRLPIDLQRSHRGLSRSPSYVQDLREGLHGRGIVQAIKNYDTATLFDWLIEIFSLQGFSDGVALGYITEHGNVRWSDMANGLSQSRVRTGSLRTEVSVANTSATIARTGVAGVRKVRAKTPAALRSPFVMRVVRKLERRNVVASSYNSLSRGASNG